MPYIDKDCREELEHRPPQTPGELNYAITLILVEYLNSHAMTYSAANEVVGVLEAVKQEFYRRKVAPYEDVKLSTNGDVY